MTIHNNTISESQLFLFIFFSMLGIRVFMHPSSMTHFVGNDEWIVTAVAGVIAAVFAFIIYKAGTNNGSSSFVEILRRIFGSTIGVILAIPVFIYFLISGAIEIRLFGEISKLYLLYRTPIEYIIIPLLAVSVYAARGGIETLARFFELIFPLVVAVLVFLFVISITNNDYTNLLPMLHKPPEMYLKSINDAIDGHSGFETLIVLFPFLKKSEGAYKKVLTAIISITVFLIFFDIECIAKFGVKETDAQLFPLVTLIKASSFPEFFIERAEGLLLALWVVFEFASIAIYIYVCSVIVGDVFKQAEKKHMALAVIPFMYIVSLQGGDMKSVIEISQKLTLYLGYYTMLVLPAAMYMLSNLGRSEKNET